MKTEEVQETKTQFEIPAGVEFDLQEKTQVVRLTLGTTDDASGDCIDLESEITFFENGNLTVSGDPKAFTAINIEEAVNRFLELIFARNPFEVVDGNQESK